VKGHNQAVQLHEMYGCGRAEVCRAREAAQGREKAEGSRAGCSQRCRPHCQSQL